MPRHSSLAGQLYRRVTLLIAVIATAMAILLFAIVRNDIDTRADEQLMTSAHVLLLLMREELEGDAAKALTDRDRPTERLLSDEDVSAFQASAPWRQFAVYHDGVIAMHPRDTSLTARMEARPGFQDVDLNGHAWRIYGLAIPVHRLLIVVAERSSVRGALIWQGAERLLLPTLLLIVGSSLLLWLALHRGLADVDRLRLTLIARTPQDLLSLDPADWPMEFQGLILSINRLFARLRSAFEKEQALSDEIAHQLRTPLAALKIQAQLLAKAVHDECQQDAEALLASVDRTSEIVAHMLQLARLDATELSIAEVDLVALVTDLITDRALIAARAGAEFALTHADVIQTRTDAGCLAVAVSALIDNAIAHAACGSLIEVSVARNDDGCRVCVHDRGPGIAGDRKRALLMALSSTDGLSHGLGLPIARRAVSILGGELLLEDRDGAGLSAIIKLPV